MTTEPDGEPPGFLLGTEGDDYLRIVVRRRLYPGADDYWDGNWVAAEVSVRAGAFQGAFEASLRTTDFESFRRKLGALYEKLSGEAVFETMERWVDVRVVGDGRGHFEARCGLRDDASFGNRLTFSLAFDQTQVPAVLGRLDEIVRRFPVRARPAP